MIIEPLRSTMDQREDSPDLGQSGGVMPRRMYSGSFDIAMMIAYRTLVASYERSLKPKRS
jgi:hypothetical protein